MNISKELNNLLFRGYNLLREFSEYVPINMPEAEDIKSLTPSVKVIRLEHYRFLLSEAIRLVLLLYLEESDKESYIAVKRLRKAATTFQEKVAHISK